jgi:hypothetical protein
MVLPSSFLFGILCEVIMFHMRATHSAHLALPDLITLTIFGEEYKF